MPWTSDIVDKIDDYLSGIYTDDDLETWVVANLQDILDSGDAEAIGLADEVDASFIELGEGIIDPTTLRARFEGLARKNTTAAPLSSKYISLTGKITRNEDGMVILLCEQLPVGGLGATPEEALASFTHSLQYYLPRDRHASRGQLARLASGETFRFRIEFPAVA